MNKIKFIYMAIPFFFIGLFSIVLYIFMELQPRIRMTPIGRIIILGFFCIFTYFGSLLLCKAEKGKKEKIMKCTFAVYFILYLGLLLNFTIFDPMFARSGTGNTVFSDPGLFKNYMSNSFNIIPFSTISMYLRSYFNHEMNFSVIITNIFGNLIALTPMALFLPIMIKKCNKAAIFALITAIAVIVIELLQLFFVTGSCDIDDLILNVSGAVIAYALLHIKSINKLIQKITIVEF